MICINEGGDPNRCALWIWNVRWNLLYSIQVHLRPIELYINLYLILQEASITDDPDFHVTIEVTKNSRYIPKMFLPRCSMVTPNGRHIKVDIKPTKGD